MECCDFSPDGLFFVIGYRSMIIIWDMKTGDRVHTLQWHGRCWTIACAVSYDDSFLASVFDDGTAKVWDPRSGDLLCTTLKGHTHRITTCSFSPRETTLFATGSSDVRVWNARTGECVRILTTTHALNMCGDGHVYAHICDGFCRAVCECAFMPDGLHIATAIPGCGRAGGIYYWNVQTGVCVHKIESCDIGPWYVTFDGARVMCQWSTELYIWNTPHQFQPRVKVLLMILAGNRIRRLRLPAELWQWMENETFV